MIVSHTGYASMDCMVAGCLRLTCMFWHYRYWYSYCFAWQCTDTGGNRPVMQPYYIYNYKMSINWKLREVFLFNLDYLMALCFAPRCSVFYLSETDVYRQPTSPLAPVLYEVFGGLFYLPIVSRLLSLAIQTTDTAIAIGCMIVSCVMQSIYIWYIIQCIDHYHEIEHLFS